MEQHISDVLDWAVKVATLVGIVVGLFRIKELHLTMNSRLDQLLESEGSRQRAEGVAEGRAQKSDGA
jgi:hypothetical protein